MSSYIHRLQGLFEAKSECIFEVAGTSLFQVPCRVSSWNNVEHAEGPQTKQLDAEAKFSLKRTLTCAMVGRVCLDAQRQDRTKLGPFPASFSRQSLRTLKEVIKKSYAWLTVSPLQHDPLVHAMSSARRVWALPHLAAFLTFQLEVTLPLVKSNLIGISDLFFVSYSTASSWLLGFRYPTLPSLWWDSRDTRVDVRRRCKFN